MIRQQCAAKGFDAVEPDIDDSYTDSTGFPITEAQNEAYDRTLAAYAHHLGLAWGQKNGDNDPAFSAALEPTTDFLLTEECRYYQTCGIVTPPYVRAGKLVLDAEYTNDWGRNVAVDLATSARPTSRAALTGRCSRRLSPGSAVLASGLPGSGCASGSGPGSTAGFAGPAPGRRRRTTRRRGRMWR